MDQNLTELVFILDRSGSMADLVQDTIGGFNSMLARQKKQEGRALVTTVLFDTEFETLHDRLDIQRVSPMTEREYQPQGCTALLDAVGDAVRHIMDIHKYAREEDVPAHTVFVITTDGMENASHRYRAEEVKRLIERQRREQGWEFIFLGANIDAVETGARFGIAPERSVNYRADSRGTKLGYAAVDRAIEIVRSCAPLADDWRQALDEDYQERG